jgi:hypothetical protein
LGWVSQWISLRRLLSWYPGFWIEINRNDRFGKKLPRKPSTQNLYSDPEGIHSYSLSNKIDPRFAPAIVISSGEVFKIKIAG